MSSFCVSWLIYNKFFNILLFSIWTPCRTWRPMIASVTKSIRICRTRRGNCSIRSVEGPSPICWTFSSSKICRKMRMANILWSGPCDRDRTRDRIIMHNIYFVRGKWRFLLKKLSCVAYKKKRIKIWFLRWRSQVSARDKVAVATFCHDICCSCIYYIGKMMELGAEEDLQSKVFVSSILLNSYFLL